MRVEGCLCGIAGRTTDPRRADGGLSGSISASCHASDLLSPLPRTEHGTHSVSVTFESEADEILRADHSRTASAHEYSSGLELFPLAVAYGQGIGKETVEKEVFQNLRGPGENDRNR